MICSIILQFYLFLHFVYLYIILILVMQFTMDFTILQLYDDRVKRSERCSCAIARDLISEHEWRSQFAQQNEVSRECSRGTLLTYCTRDSSRQNIFWPQHHYI